MQVSRADAAIDENTVVVRLGHTMFAHTAVLRARGLEELAGAAVSARVEHGEVERVLGHLKSVVLASDVAWVDATGEIQEDIGADDSDGGKGAVERREQRPSAGKKHVFAAGKKAQEEYDDGRVTVVEHVVAKALEIAGQTATGDAAVERK